MTRSHPCRGSLTVLPQEESRRVKSRMVDTLIKGLGFRSIESSITAKGIGTFLLSEGGAVG